MSTEPRTAMVDLLVVKALEVDEPDWCAGHSADVAEFKPDVTHYGPPETLDFQGETLWTVMLAQSPFASDADARTIGVYVESGSLATSLDPAGLDALAAALVEHAAVLRHRARVLGSMLGGGQ
ncbi:DUF6907 domain-containing protein [Streptomyces sp. NBC_00258]|uniref:DUF6907 domain-containing protein n=1 Tax=Streptomyces sp. NBC_00258 TaxID=2903642 RepID=UPI002E2E31B5|nr:hypothetical protein [Streptomyces sp. NBC_00258]